MNIAQRWSALTLVLVALLAPATATASPADSATSATDGTRTLTVSQTVDLDEAGATVVVTGTGFDVTQGIYVALCVVQPEGQQPSPCGGGADREGDGGASAWISSNAPSYGDGLTLPYGDGGSFMVEVTIRPTIDAANDCRAVACAIVTKNDHTALSNRSQDLIIPVTFTGEAPDTTAATTSTTAGQSSGSDPEVTSDTAVELTLPSTDTDTDTGADAGTDTGGGSGAWAAGAAALVALVAVVAGAVVMLRRRKGLR